VSQKTKKAGKPKPQKEVEKPNGQMTLTFGKKTK
jgi:hypothetical protein